MIGTVPAGRAHAGVFNLAVEAPALQLYLECSPRRSGSELPVDGIGGPAATVER